MMQTALDHIDPFVMMADTLAGLMQTRPALAAATDAGTQAQLQALMAHAELQRQKAAAKAAS